MNYLYVELNQKMFINAAIYIIEQEAYLTEIDSVIGDGDHGIGMKRGWMAVHKLLLSKEYEYTDDLCYDVGLELLKTMGGASGVIFGTMFVGGIKKLPHENRVNTNMLYEYFCEGEKAIEHRGKAKVGYKTMLDALWPACKAMEEAIDESDDILNFFQKAYFAAKKGADESKKNVSRTGRSKNFRDKTIGLSDPGAISTSFIFKSFYETIKNNKR
ncbi:MAG: dihydroxyacetone kinase subunit DhaL [Suipraeoptans sp.]